MTRKSENRTAWAPTGRNVADLHSVLAEPIRHFVKYKRALNRKYRPEAAALRLFDRYLCEHAATGWDSVAAASPQNCLASFSATDHLPSDWPWSYRHLLLPESVASS
jgi:hypothetical protein